MALVFEILLGVMILASFFVAYKSASTWPIYQVILAELVFLGSIGFMYLAARTLATQTAWRNAVKTKQADLTRIEGEIKQIVEGGPADPTSGQPNPKGIRQLQQQLAKLAVERGGVLYDVAVEGVKDGTVQLKAASPEHGLVANSVVFAFDQSKFAEGGRYHGEFKVTTAAENNPAIEVEANLPLTESQAKRLAAAKGPWTLYSTMPVDDPAVLAALDDAARQALLPAESVAEFAKTDRQARDYEVLFHEHFVQRSLLNDAIMKLQSNIERTEAATKEANTEIGYRETETTNLTADSEKFKYEEKAIAAYRQTLEKRLEQARNRLRAAYTTARQRAAELTANQLRAAKGIDGRKN
jgi:hypothetical protein